MKGVIDFEQLGLKAKNLDRNCIPVSIYHEAVFMPYHTHITGTGHGLIAVGHPPYDNNLLVEAVVASLFAQLQDSEGQLPQEVLASMEEFGKEVVKYLVSNTLREKGDGKRGSYRREYYELRLIKTALAVERYFQTPLIDNPVGCNSLVEKASEDIEEKVSGWLGEQ